VQSRWAHEMRRQGARTDLQHSEVPRAPLSLSTIARAMITTADQRTRLRFLFEFMRGADEAGAAALTLIQQEPAPTGSTRFDALLGAAAEHLAARFGQPGPVWTTTVDRFLDSGWWVSDLASARAFALVWAPPSFRRRGIYLDRHDLRTDETQLMADPVFDRSDLHRAFMLLASKLERKCVVGHVHVVAGTAMLLAYDSRVTTRDIDAFSPPMARCVRQSVRFHPR
jgi:hypothetical protein